MCEVESFSKVVLSGWSGKALAGTRRVLRSLSESRGGDGDPAASVKRRGNEGRDSGMGAAI